MTYQCPECSRPLVVHKETSHPQDMLPEEEWNTPLEETGEVTLYCSWGECKDQQMNNGAVGATAAEAYEKLVKANDAWLKERFNRGIEMERYPK